MRASAFFIALGFTVALPSCGFADRWSFAEPAAVHRLAPGLTTGPAPKTRVELQRLQSAGVQRVVDLRTLRILPGWLESRRARSLGMQYVRIPIGLRPLRRGRLPELLRAMDDSFSIPTYVHCHLGSDRTGLATALFRTETQGVAPEVAHREFRQHRFNHRLRGLDEAFWSVTSR